MKFQTNFTFHLGRLVPALAAAGWGAFGLALLLGLSLVWTAVQDRKENPALEKQLSELRGNPPDPSPSPAKPSERELADLGDRLRDLNGLGAGVGEPVLSVFGRLEGLLPPGSRLASFQQEEGTGHVQMVVEAYSLETLSRFLSALEGDGSFGQVNLVKQGRGGQDNLIQFSVEMEARP